MKIDKKPPEPIEAIDIIKEPCVDLTCDDDGNVHATASFRTNLTAVTNDELNGEFFAALIKWGVSRGYISADEYNLYEPEKVILNDPAVVCMWSDGTKAVAKCHGGDEYNPLFGIMACAMRKVGHNRIRIDAWEDVIAFLADSLANADECYALADMLMLAGDAMELPGVMDELEKYDVREDEPEEDGIELTPLFEGDL